MTKVMNVVHPIEFLADHNGCPSGFHDNISFELGNKNRGGVSFRILASNLSNFIHEPLNNSRPRRNARTSYTISKITGCTFTLSTYFKKVLISSYFKQQCLCLSFGSLLSNKRI